MALKQPPAQTRNRYKPSLNKYPHKVRFLNLKGFSCASIQYYTVNTMSFYNLPAATMGLIGLAESACAVSACVGADSSDGAEQ